MANEFLRVYPPAAPVAGRTIWLPFRGGELLVREEGEQLTLIDGDDLVELLATPHVYFATFDTAACVACEIGEAAVVPSGYAAVGLRSLYGRLDDASYQLAGLAAQLLYWRKTSNFCAVCGSATEDVGGDWGRRCSSCGHVTYPRISPAILALIHDGDRVLLTHKPGWSKTYSLVAGFVEPGESLETCVEREVREEVGVRLNDIRYVGSQPWPFPHQLMIGFTAQYAGDEIAIDQVELDDARWFHVDDLPQLPAPLSLSRQIIDGWVKSRRP